MPRVSRKKLVEVPPDQIYDLVSDPRRLGEWWPRVTRIENVEGKAGAARTRWTSVLAADSGRKLRMDYQCIAATRPERYGWQQELEGTPFEEHLLRQATLVKLNGTAQGTLIELTAEHTLKGSARLAGFMMRKTQKQMLDTALASLQRCFDGSLENGPAG